MNHLARPRRIVLLALALSASSLGCKSKAKSKAKEESAETAKASDAASQEHPVDSKQAAQEASADSQYDVPEKAPETSLAELVFEGWPILLDAEGPRVLCAVDQGDTISIDLGDTQCDNREDEVAIEYKKSGAPAREDAVSEVAQRLPVCGPNAKAFDRILWYPGTRKLAVAGWGLGFGISEGKLEVEGGAGKASIDLPTDVSLRAVHSTPEGKVVVAQFGDEEHTSSCVAVALEKAAAE